MATVVYIRSLQVLVLMFFLCNERLAIAQYPDKTANDPVDGCPIPPGMHNDQWNASYVPEPHAGGLCKNFSFPNTQRWSWRCQPTYCCGQPCDCNTSSRDYPMYCDSEIVQQICYIVTFSMNNYKYQCCPGFHEDDKQVCIPNDPCVGNTLRCQFNCLTTNGTSQCTCPPGLVLNPADTTHTTCIDPCVGNTLGCQFNCLTTNGTSQCTCPPGHVLNPADTTHTTCIEVTTTAASTTTLSTTPLPVLVTSGAFPAQYIAAAVVGGVVFIGLLVGLIIFICRPHPEIVPAVVVVGDEIKKKIDVDDMDVVVVGKKLDADEKKDPLYETIKEIGGRRHQDPRPSPNQQQQQQQGSDEVDLTSGGRKAQPNIYSSLSGRTPAVRSGINDLATSGTVGDTTVTPVRFVVSDNNSDYAEIVAEQDTITRI